MSLAVTVRPVRPGDFEQWLDTPQGRFARYLAEH